MSQDQTQGTNWRGLFTSKHATPAGSVMPLVEEPAPMPTQPVLVVDHSAQETQQVEDDPKAYRALQFDPTARQHYLEIRYFSPPPMPGIKEGYLLSLAQFVLAQYFGENQVVLQFTNVAFKIEGRGLNSLVEGLKRGVLKTVQQHSPLHWGEPAPDEPKVTAIEVITPERIAELQRQLQAARQR